MSDTAFRLASTIGRSYGVNPDDTRRIKVALKDLGYLDPPAYGLTPYPDERMFRSIERFQQDFGLRPDGIVKPAGETAAKLAEALAARQLPGDASGAATGMSVPTGGPSSDTVPPRSPTTRGSTPNQQIAVAPAVPVVVYEIAAFFGMSVAAAYSWWLSLSERDKEEVRSKVESSPRRRDQESPSEAECEELNRIDTRTCKQIAKKRGPAAGYRCHASASDRYSACLRGRPRDEWPPLNTWNN